MISSLLPLSVAVVFSGISAATDLGRTRIPNWLTLNGMLAGLALGTARGGAVGLLGAGLGLVLCAAAPLALFASTRGRAMGGGDVKALAAIGAIVGPTRGLEVEMTALSLVALVSLAALALRGQLTPVLHSSFRLALGWLGPKTATSHLPGPTRTPVKLGPALCAACLLCAAAHAGPVLWRLG